MSVRPSVRPFVRCPPQKPFDEIKNRTENMKKRSSCVWQIIAEQFFGMFLRETSSLFLGVVQFLSQRLAIGASPATDVAGVNPE